MLRMRAGLQARDIYYLMVGSDCTPTVQQDNCEVADYSHA